MNKTLLEIAYGNLMKREITIMNGISSGELNDIRDKVRKRVLSRLPERVYLTGGFYRAEDGLEYPRAIELIRGVNCMQVTSKGGYCRQELVNGEPTCRWHRKIKTKGEYKENRMITVDELREYGTVTHHEKDDYNNERYVVTMSVDNVPELKRRIGEYRGYYNKRGVIVECTLYKNFVVV